MARELVVEGFGVAGLEAVVELLADRARELVDELARVDELERAHTLADQARGLVEQREVGFDLARGVRALNLDRDPAAVRERGAVHLADRGGGDGRLVEVGEELLDAQLELLADHALDVLVWDRADVVLELLQLEHDVGRDDVGTRREQLAELDEGRPELVEHLAQVPAAFRRVRRRGVELGVARQQVGQAVGLEEVAEAVPDRDLGDLGDPAQIPPAGRARHVVSVPRGQWLAALRRRVDPAAAGAVGGLLPPAGGRRPHGGGPRGAAAWGAPRGGGRRGGAARAGGRPPPRRQGPTGGRARPRRPPLLPRSPPGCAAGRPPPAAPPRRPSTPAGSTAASRTC